MRNQDYIGAAVAIALAGGTCLVGYGALRNSNADLERRVGAVETAREADSQTLVEVKTKVDLIYEWLRKAK